MNGITKVALDSAIFHGFKKLTVEVIRSQLFMHKHGISSEIFNLHLKSYTNSIKLERYM